MKKDDYYVDAVLVETVGRKQGWVKICPRDGRVRWHVYGADGFRRELGHVALDDLDEKSRRHLRQAKRWSGLTRPEREAKAADALAKYRANEKNRPLL